MSVCNLLASAAGGKLLNEDEAITLLSVNYKSQDFYEILSTANYLSRTKYSNRGLVFAQIGINAEPCSINCRFCSMGQDHYALPVTWKKSADEISKEVEQFVASGINDLFLMTIADYPVNDFLKIGGIIKKYLPENLKLVANIGDFNLETAKKLKETGFTGAYHIHRLREGVDTTIKPETRINTLNAIRDAGLELYYCVEPIGPEHSYKELAAEMLRARDYEAKVMAVMRRIPVKGTPLYGRGKFLQLS